MSDAKNLVCIEDDLELVEILRIILKNRGYKITGAIGGPAGLETLRRVKPDLVLLDLMMPGMDGWEVHRQMKADADLCHIPVIIVTADGQPTTKLRGLEIAKVADFVVKPFDVQELVESIEKALEAK